MNAAGKAKRRKTVSSGKRASKQTASLCMAAPHDPKAWMPAPKLRRLLNISAVTLWRWRHNETLKFPRAKEINGRLYFRWGAVCEWYQRQPNAQAEAA